MPEDGQRSLPQDAEGAEEAHAKRQDDGQQEAGREQAGLERPGQVEDEMEQSPGQKAGQDNADHA